MDLPSLAKILAVVCCGLFSGERARVLLERWGYLHAARTAVSLIAFVYLLYLTVAVK
jgi:hypothetical protein